MNIEQAQKKLSEDMKKVRESRFKGWTKKDISEYHRYIRLKKYGWKWNKEKKLCYFE